jgi:uncharacterized protein YhaN
MRIDEIFIDGYGLFHEFSLDDLSPASTVILGPNESGKTTLLSFIRAILFGFLDRRSAENLYEPLRGGRHGGRIALVDGRNRRFIVERYPGPRGGTVTVTLPDGSPGGANDLAVLLGHTSRDLFRNVFAFSLAELQDFDTLSSDEVRARVYGAGIGAGRLGLPEIERKIEEDRGELYKEAGSKQVMADLLRKAEEVRRRLRELGSQAAEHDRLRSDLDRLTGEIEAEAEERQKAYVERDHTANLLRAWEDWIDLRSAEEQLGGLEKVTEFPSEAITRLESFLQRREVMRDGIEELKNQIAANEEELKRIHVDEKVLEQTAAIEGLNRGLDKYESAKDDLPERKSELKSAIVDLQDGLRDLGPDWTEDRVRGFETSVPTREAVRGHGEGIKTTAVRLHDAELDSGRAAEDLETANVEHDRLEKELGGLDEPPERDRKVLEEKRGKLRELRSLVSGHERHRQEIRHLEERRSDLEVRCTSIERQMSREMLALPAWPAAVVLLVSLAAAVLLALLTSWIAGGVVAVLGVAVAAGYHRLRGGLETRAQETGLDNELETVRSQLKEIDIAAKAVDSDLKKDESTIRSLAKELDIDSAPSEQDLNRLEGELDKALKSLDRWEETENRVKEAAARVEDRKKRVQTAKRSEDKARKEATRAQEAWQKWLEKHNIDETVIPETCLELISMVESLREKTKAIDTLRDRITEIEGAMEGYEKQTNAVRQGCDLPEKSRTAFPAAVDELVEASREASESSNRAGQLRKTIDDAKARLKDLEDRAQDVTKEVTALLSEGGASDEESFRNRAKIFDQREELISTIRNLTKNLERIAGRDRLKAFMRDLETANPEQLHQMQREVNERLEEIEARLDEMRDERAQLTEKISQIETEEESSELRLRQAVLQERLHSDARKWSVLTIGKALLAETRLKYERERQPAVIQEAQRFFSSFTTGRYERIFSLPGEDRIAVEDRAGKRKDLSELSRGTIEQLYLALRFGLVREFPKRAEPMPVIMDDILVNFDPDRAREACRALGELSKEQQVLLFTCHPETVELVKSEAADCRVIELPPEPS